MSFVVVESKSSGGNSYAKDASNTKTTTNKTVAGRNLTSQEESILLPLIQGLIAANAASSDNTDSKQKNTTERVSHETSFSRRSSGTKTSQQEANNELNAKGKMQTFRNFNIHASGFIHDHSLLIGRKRKFIGSEWHPS